MRGSSGLSVPVPILYVHYGDEWIRGSERLLLDLLSHLDRSRFAPVVWCNAGEMENAVRELDVPVYRSRFDLLLTSIQPNHRVDRWVRQIQEGRRIAARHGIRIIHSNSGGPVQWMLPVARSRRIPILAHLHAPYLKRDRYAFGLRFVDRIVGVSKHALRGFESDGVRKEKLRVIYNGIDTARLQPTPPDPELQMLQASGRVVLTFAGSLIHRKGVDLLLRAIQKTPDVELVIAGDGPDRALMEALAAQLNVAGRVQFRGYCADLSSLYRATDIAVHAARSEAFGLVLAEAGFMGVPVIAARVGGIPEVVRDDETGLLCEPESVEAFSSAIRMLARDVPKRLAFGEAAREWIRQQFTADAMATGFEALYTELSGSTAP